MLTAAFTGSLAFATIAQAQTTSRMKITTDLPPQITTPDSVDTRIGTLKGGKTYKMHLPPNIPEERRVLRGVRKTNPLNASDGPAVPRLYGPLQPWFDQTWKPGECEFV